MVYAYFILPRAHKNSVVRAKLLNHTKNRTLVTCVLTNINKMPYFYWREIPPGFEFYVVTCSYSSHPFLCALDITHGAKYHYPHSYQATGWDTRLKLAGDIRTLTVWFYVSPSPVDTLPHACQCTRIHINY